MMFSLEIFCQPLDQDYSSRLEMNIFTPEFIEDHKIRTVKISSYIFDRGQLEYEFQYSKFGTLKHVKFSQHKKRIKIDPEDFILHPSKAPGSLDQENYSVTINYLQDIKMLKLSYHYKVPMIGCPVKAIYLYYDCYDRVIKDVVVNCLDSAITSYSYKNSLLIWAHRRTYKTNRYTLNPKETINETFELKYTPSGLIQEIQDSIKQSVYKKYYYTLRK